MAAALLLPVLAIAVAVAAAAATGAVHDGVNASLLELAGSPVALLTFALFVLIFGPVPEEIDWRGCAGCAAGLVQCTDREPAARHRLGALARAVVLHRRLVAIVFHFMINFVVMLVEGAPGVECTRTGLTAALALLIVRWDRGHSDQPG